MSQPVEFTRQFARLVWLLVHRASDVDEQKAALRVSLAATRGGRREIELTDLNRSIGSAVQISPAPAELPWITELATRMGSHSVGSIDFSASARATDVLGVARALAGQAVQGDDGTNFDSRMVALAPTSVTVRLGRAGFVRRATPIAMTRIDVIRPRRTPGIGSPGVESEPAYKYGRAATPPPRSSAVDTRGIATPVVPRRGLSDDSGQMIAAEFTRGGPSRSLKALGEQLANDPNVETAPRILDDLVRMAEEYARDGLWAGVCEAAGHVLACEVAATDANVKRAATIQLRRLTKPGILRGLAQLLVRHHEVRTTVHAFFARAGEVGADVLIELLVSAEQPAERRAYREAIPHCPSAGPALVHLLDDPRWYVARNAVELLGEMQLPDGDGKLVGSMRHRDARVRRSAAAALAKFGSSRALHALQRALGDDSPSVRLQAALGLSAARNPRSVPPLIEALDREHDADVQHALIAALGNHPTNESVDRLVSTAQPGSLLNRRPTMLRVAALTALADAGTHAALAAVRGFLTDRDRDVRTAADRLLAAHAQASVVAR